MRYLVSTCARILTVLATLIFFAGPLQADPVVTFGMGGTGAPVDIRFAESTFILGTTDGNGMLTVVLRNVSNARFLDFHFETMTLQNANWTGNGLPFFSNFSSDRQRIDFVRGGTGTGIGFGTTFTVTFTGFSANMRIDAKATVPEPATLLLLGSGLAGIAIKMRKKLKDRKSG